MQRSLCQLILLNGMLTDANLPGVEKLCVTLVQSNWLTLPLHKISREDIGFEAALAPPESCFMVKGWNRSVAFLGICLAAFMDSSLLDAFRMHLWNCARVQYTCNMLKPLQLQAMPSDVKASLVSNP